MLIAHHMSTLLISQYAPLMEILTVFLTLILFLIHLDRIPIILDTSNLKWLVISKLMFLLKLIVYIKLPSNVKILTAWDIYILINWILLLLHGLILDILYKACHIEFVKMWEKEMRLITFFSWKKAIFLSNINKMYK